MARRTLHGCPKAHDKGLEDIRSNQALIDEQRPKGTKKEAQCWSPDMTKIHKEGTQREKGGAVGCVVCLLTCSKHTPSSP